MDDNKKKEINSLVKRIGKGDEEAFESLYNLIYKDLFCFLKKFTYNKEDIKDVIINTFIIVIEKSKTLLFYKDCYAWIFNIAKYQIFNINRKILTEINLDDENIKYLCSENNLIESITITGLIDQLPKDLKLIFYLHYRNAYTIKEISNMTKVSESTIKRRIKTIKDHFEESINEKENIR